MASPRYCYVGCALASILAAFAGGTLWTAPARVTALDSAQPSTPVAALASGSTLDGPFTHANLTIYVVRGSTTDRRQYLTLDEGLAARSVAVREKTRAGQDRAEVNELEIENRSDQWLFLQAGDIVKGGKQDRTIMTDLMLAPHSAPQPIEAFCVEHGRWTPSADGYAFRNNPGIVAGASLKIAIQGEKSQPRVWQEVEKADRGAITAARAAGAPLAADIASLSSTGTYNAIAENKTLSASRDAYVAALLPQIRKHPNAIGLAVAINGRVTSADVYASPALFQQLAPKLLKSYALEGVLARPTSPQTATAPTRQQVMAFLAKPAAARADREIVGKSMQRATHDTDEMVMYEYGQIGAAAGAANRITVVHQSYLKK